MPAHISSTAFRNRLAGGDAGSALRNWRSASASTLHLAGALWLLVAVLGQLLLALYVVGFYWLAAAQGRLEDWTKVLTHGWVQGEPFLNAVLATHLFFVVLIIVGGSLQLLPWLRRTRPGFHRWSGRLYLLSASVLSAGGLIMVWTRGTVGDLSQHLAISVNALLILVFSAIAWRRARERQLDAHRRWALRLFLAVSGVWFFRIGLMLWIVVNKGASGFDPESFTGPFLTGLSFGQYLVPLAVLELYLRVQAKGGAGARMGMATAMLGMTLATLGGIAAATAILWLPRL